MAALCGVENNSYARELLWSKADLISDQDTSIRQIRSDERGIWTVDGISLALTDRLTATVFIADSISQTFGDDRRSQTLENGTDFVISYRADTKNSWITRISASSSKQEIHRFVWSEKFNRYKNGVYSISEGWQRRLAKGLIGEVFGGISRCESVEQNQREFVPFGGIRLQKQFAWGDVSASLFQGVIGGGSLTSIYGSQQIRQFELSGNVPITHRFSIDWNCSVSIADGMFNSKDMLQRAPLISAGGSIQYRIVSKIIASLGYAHRKLMSSNIYKHGAVGPMATASITYNLF